MFIALFAFTACMPAALSSEYRYEDFEPRLAYQGFSFDRPPNGNWFLRKAEESYTDVTLRRRIDSPTHSFYASVSLGGIERVASSHEEFAELARAPKLKAPYTVRVIEYKQELTTRQNQWCVRFEAEHLAFGAPANPSGELTLILRGYRCVHPTWSKTTLDFFYSERGLPSEIDPALWAEGEAFLRGVRIDVAPGTPAS